MIKASHIYSESVNPVNLSKSVKARHENKAPFTTAGQFCLCFVPLTVGLSIDADLAIVTCI